jgi:SAM-dependent methyltransferase
MSRDRVAEYWSDHDFTDHLARIHWMGSPVVRAYLNRLASGDPDVDWLTWAWDAHVRPGLRQLDPGGSGDVSVLVLGCGSGWLERALVASFPEVTTVDACDVAAGAVEEAAETARREGLGERIRYHVVDLNVEPPPGGPYQVAVAHSVLHHVENLELAYPALVDALVPGGLLVVNEYVGPSRFQFCDAQMAVINGVLARLPERLRRSAVMGGAVYPHKEVPTVEQMIATDPSESVRSAELAGFTRHFFEVLEERPYGGTVLQHLLYDVVQNFDPAALPDVRLLALVCLLEEGLIRSRALPSDYTLTVARRAPAGEDGDALPPAYGEAAAGPGSWATDAEPPRALPVRQLAARQRAAEEAPPAAPAPAPVPRLCIHSRPAREHRLGTDWAPLRDHLHRLATGDPACDWLTWTLGEVARDAPAGARALVVEEPPAWLAPAVAAARGVTAVDLLVPVPDDDRRLRFALRRAGEEASPPAALTDLELAAGAYRYLFSGGWLGRVASAGVDRAIFARRLGSALAPGGRWFGDEWLGPADGRTSPRTLAWARQLAELLQPAGAPPADWRRRLRDRWVDFEHRALRSRFGPPAPCLAALLGPDFEIPVLRATGGALTQRLLAGAAAGLDPEHDADHAFLALAAYLEELLGAAGAVESEYVCFAARKRPAPAS